MAEHEKKYETLADRRMMSTDNRLNNILTENINLLKRYRNEFMEIFGVDPRNYWTNNLLGFDVIGFDEKFIKTPDNISMKEYVTEKYGKKGFDVVAKISGIDFDEE